jgi:hypothetical protein
LSNVYRTGSRETIEAGRFDVDLGGVLGDPGPGLVGAHRAAGVLADRREVDRHRVDAALVDREDAVLVVREVGEPVDVGPHALVRRVEQVRPVAVHLDPGLGVRLRVGVAAEVGAALDDEDALVQFRRGAFGDRQTEEARAHDDQIRLAHG